MSNSLSRRAFLAKAAAMTAGAAGLGGCENRPDGVGGTPTTGRVSAGRLRKAVCWSMLPGGMSVEDRFTLVRDAGFAGVEVPTAKEPGLVDRMRAAAEKSGVRIHSVMNSDHWRFPLSSDAPETVRQGVACMVTSLHNAQDWGADTVLLVPGVVDANTRYADAWARSTAAIREKLIPVAKETGVVIAVENVWNRFLLSPREFVQYLDQFDGRHVRAYFDVGNVAAYGFPGDWIRTLGDRIAKVHVKDFDTKNHKFVPLLEGSIDWKVVREAFDEVGYGDFVTAELPAGNAKYLRGVSERMSQILEGVV